MMAKRKGWFVRCATTAFVVVLCAASPLAAEELLHWGFDPSQEMWEADLSGRGHGAQLLREEVSASFPERLAQGMRHEADGSVRLGDSTAVRLANPVALPRRWTLSFWLKDERPVDKRAGELALADVVSLKTRLLGFSEPWRFRPDPDDVGLDENWHQDDDNGRWQRIAVPAFWSETHVGGDYYGYGWYRTRFFVPEQFSGQSHELHFEGVDEQAWVFVNGEYVGEQTEESTGQTVSDIWDAPFTLTIPAERLRAGEANLLVVRCHAGAGEAGIFQPLQFRPPTDQRREADLTGLSGTRTTAGGWEHVAVTVEPDRTTLYLNGRWVASVQRSLWPHEVRHVEIEFSGRGENRFSGRLDEVRVFQGALSAEAVADLATYRPDAQWLREQPEAMRSLIQTQTLSRDRAEHLARLGAPDTRALRATAATSEHIEHRVDAIWALSRLGDPEVVPAVIEQLDSAEAVAEAATEALRHLQDENIFPRTLQQRDDAEAASLLGKVARHSSDIGLQLASVNALRETGGEAASDDLVRAAEHGGWRVRYQAARALQEIDAPEEAGSTGRLPRDPVFRSPYDNVDWQEIQQYKMDSHAHARRGLEVEDVVRFYDQLGYGAVSFKDRNLQYPLEDHVDDPAAYDITLLPGQNIKPYRDEEPYEQHLKLWFSETNHSGRLEFDEAFEQMGEDGGLVVFAHPASHIYPMYSVHVGVEWYIDYFDRHPHALGIEVNNHDMAGSLELFDELLGHYGAERLVVGLGVTDLIGLRDDGRLRGAGGFGLSLVISEDRRMSSLREAIEAGRLFWVDTPEPHPDDGTVQFPRIASIDVEGHRIRVNMEDEYERIRWIHANEVVKEGEELTFDDLVAAEGIRQEPNYVRFEITDGEGATLGSQAFYIVDP